MAETPTCPRCGYDQRGVIDSWKNECPLTGICSECGLTFAWGDLLGVRAKLLPGFFEHATGIRRSFKWAWRTWAWTIIPGHFWSRVRMHHHLAPNRTWLWLAVILLPIHLIGLLASFAGIWMPYGLSTRSYNEWLWSESVAALFQPVVEVWPRHNGGIFGGWSLDVESFSLLRWPLCLTVGLGVWCVLTIVFALLSDTRRVYKVQLAHTARVCVYGLGWVVPFAAFYMIYRVLMGLEYIGAMSMRSRNPGFGSYPGGSYLDIAMWIRSTGHFIDKLLIIPVLAWIAWWWWIALSRGLEIDRAGRIWCVLMVPAVLMTAIVISLVYVARAEVGMVW